MNVRTYLCTHVRIYVCAVRMYALTHAAYACASEPHPDGGVRKPRRVGRLGRARRDKRGGSTPLVVGYATRWGGKQVESRGARGITLTECRRGGEGDSDSVSRGRGENHNTRGGDRGAPRVGEPRDW